MIELDVAGVLHRWHKRAERVGTESWYRELVLEDTLRLWTLPHSFWTLFCEGLAGLLAGGVYQLV